jgi:hypothetical protein
MYTVNLVFSDNFEKPGFEKTFGECLEEELIRLGFPVTLPSFTDWGYVFRVKYGKFDFDIIIGKAEISGNTLSVSIDSTLGRLKKLFSDDSDARESLVHCVRDALENDAFAGKRSWPFLIQG